MRILILAALIRAYMLGRKFTHTRKGRPKAESTKKEYLRMFTTVKRRFGTLPIRALKSPKVNAVFIDCHEEIALDRPREADNRMTVLSAAFSMPRRGPFILTRADGRPWHTERNDKELEKVWCRHMEAAGFYPKPFPDLTKEEKQGFLHFHDLRGTTVTLLVEAGCPYSR